MARHVRVQPAGAGQLSYDVTSEAAMTGEDLSKLNPGTFCVALDTGATYEAYQTSTTPPAGATTIAAVNGVWVLASAQAMASAGTSLVFRPGGVAAGNVYTSWSALYAALNSAAPVSANGTRPASVILIDDSFTSPAVVPAGAYNFDGVSFDAVSNVATLSGGAELDFAVGVTIAPGCTITFRNAIFAKFLGAAACITNSGATQETNIILHEGAFLWATGAGPFIDVLAGASVITAIGGCDLGDNAHALATLSGGVLSVEAYGSTAVNAGAVTGAGATVFWDSFAPKTQGAGVVVTQQFGLVSVLVVNSDIALVQTSQQDITYALSGFTVAHIALFPAAPNVGQTVTLVDTDGTLSAGNSMTLNGNGKTFNGSASIVMATAFMSLTIQYTAAAQWSVI